MIQGKAFDETIDVEDLMQEAEGKLFEISQRNVKKDVTQINPVIKDAMDMLQKAANQKEGLSGTRTGFDALDKITSGWQNSDLIIIAARPADVYKRQVEILHCRTDRVHAKCCTKGIEYIYRYCI